MVKNTSAKALVDSRPTLFYCWLHIGDVSTNALNYVGWIGSEAHDFEGCNLQLFSLEQGWGF